MGVDFKEGENMDFSFSGFESFGSSSSSDLSTLVGSELEYSTEMESTVEEDDEFMAELTRQMADYMLQEDDDDDDDEKEDEKNVVADIDSENFKEDDTNSGFSRSLVKESNSVGYQSIPALPVDQMQPIQLENQPRVGNGGNGRSGKRSESTQPNKQIKNIGKAPPIGGMSINYGTGYPPYAGSGMRAVFLNRLGSRNPSSGTGVFLPCTITNTPDQPRKKSGCSTVLIPTRVLQALEQHFSNLDSSNAHSPQQEQGRRDSTQGKGKDKGKGKGQTQLQPSRATMDHQLPQEWTY